MREAARAGSGARDPAHDLSLAARLVEAQGGSVEETPEALVVRLG